MKKALIIFIILLQIRSYANMASPIDAGTLGTDPFISQYADITREDLFIKIDSNFKYADINVKYYINVLKDGIQIPFLFYASEYLDGFTVTIDGKEVEIKKIPDKFKTFENTKFEDFSYFFDKNYKSHDNEAFTKIELSDGDLYISSDNMIYFETDISKGEHIIEVNYRARRWTDKSGQVKKYSFRYALSPAKYWKSFGILNVKIDAGNFHEKIKTNLGNPHKGDFNTIAEWSFDHLPADILEIKYKPKISNIARIFITKGFGILLLSGVLLVILHWFWIYVYRKKHPAKKYSLPVILGSITLPLLFVIIRGAYYLLTEYLLGEHAGNQGYGIVIVFFVLFYGYLFFMPAYLLINWLTDKWLKKKFSQNNN